MRLRSWVSLGLAAGAAALAGCVVVSEPGYPAGGYGHGYGYGYGYRGPPAVVRVTPPPVVVTPPPRHRHWHERWRYRNDRWDRGHGS